MKFKGCLNGTKTTYMLKKSRQDLLSLSSLKNKYVTSKGNVHSRKGSDGSFDGQGWIQSF